MKFSFWGLLIFLVASTLGWMLAHTSIAQECEKLGAFYVESVVYECKAKR